MRNLNRERKAGYLSLWFCDFPDGNAYMSYFENIFCVDDPVEHDPRYNQLRSDYLQTIERMFVPENYHRPFEHILHEHFRGGSYNRFTSDFGVTFDQDFWVGAPSTTRSDDITIVLGEWADDDLVEPIKQVVGPKLPRPYNGFFAISSCIYNGYTKNIDWGACKVDFLGVAEEDT